MDPKTIARTKALLKSNRIPRHNKKIHHIIIAAVLTDEGATCVLEDGRKLFLIDKAKARKDAAHAIVVQAEVDAAVALEESQAASEEVIAAAEALSIASKKEMKHANLMLESAKAEKHSKKLALAAKKETVKVAKAKAKKA